MTRASISEWSVDALVMRYERLSIEQGRVHYLLESVSKANRLGDEIAAISNELKRRPGDQRHLLTKLLAHSNDWVRFNAATSTISVARNEAREVLQRIADSGILPQSGHAGMYLSMYDGEMSKLFNKR